MAMTVKNTPSGKLRYGREFLLTFANFRSKRPLPDNICKYIEGNVVSTRRRERRGGVQRRLRRNKPVYQCHPFYYQWSDQSTRTTKTILRDLEAMRMNSRASMEQGGKQPTGCMDIERVPSLGVPCYGLPRITDQFRLDTNQSCSP